MGQAILAFQTQDQGVSHHEMSPEEWKGCDWNKLASRTVWANSVVMMIMCRLLIVGLEFFQCQVKST